MRILLGLKKFLKIEKFHVKIRILGFFEKLEYLATLGPNSNREMAVPTGRACKLQPTTVLSAPIGLCCTPLSSLWVLQAPGFESSRLSYRASQN